jgi:thiol-disulfide isomerase/thioredoxin
MKKICLLLIILGSFVKGQAQGIEIYNTDKLLKRASGKDSIYIINFWATWCGPCAREIPIFNKLQKMYWGKPVKILLVSLDYERDYPARIYKFIKKKKLLPQVVWFSDTDPNIFIPKIESSWQGSIPATLVLQPGQYFRQFWEGTITEDQVRNVIDKQLTFFNN